MPTTFLKDPAATLDYRWDFSAWLDGTDTITAATVTAGDGITVVSTSHDDSTVTAWVSGGTTGENYLLTCRITTADGRIDERTIHLAVRER